jgi:hypothetical protein
MMPDQASGNAEGGGAIDRRQLLKQTAAALFGWPMGKSISLFRDPSDASDEPAFAGPGAAAPWARVEGDFVPTEQTVPSLTGLDRLLGPDYRELRYYLRAADAGTLADQRLTISRRIRKLLDASPSDWRRIARTIEYLYGWFFAVPGVERDWPGFVIVMPGGYVTTRHSFGMKGVPTRLPKPSKPRRVGEPILNLSFGRMWPEFDIPVRWERIPLGVPAGRDARWAKPVIRRRVRSFGDPLGRWGPSEEIIFQVGRASPADEEALGKGLYYPCTEGKRILGPDGSVCFTRGISVLVLARLVPVTSAEDALIHQVSITVDESMEEILDINCLCRTYDRFVNHYPGMADLIRGHWNR